MSRFLIPVMIAFAFLGCKEEDVPTSIPEFSMVLPDTSQVFHSKDIPKGKPVVLIQFDPDCRDCQLETEHILANMDRYRKINFYLITRQPYHKMMVFHNHLRLDTCKNLKIGIDKNGVIPIAYKYRSTPLTLIYNTDKKLTSVLRGRAKAEQMDSLFTSSQMQVQ